MNAQPASLSDIMNDRLSTDPGYKRSVLKQRFNNRRRSAQRSFSELLYGSLRLAGWVSTTLLTAAGLFVALFLAAGNGTFAGFFEQVSLLSTRYGEVEPALRATFDEQLSIAIVLVFVVTAFFRRASLLGIFKNGGVDGPA